MPDLETVCHLGGGGSAVNLHVCRVLGRPAALQAPALALRLVAGELADELLLASQLARPSRLEEVGFSFAFPTLEDALRHELGRFGGSRGAKTPGSIWKHDRSPA